MTKNISIFVFCFSILFYSCTVEEPGDTFPISLSGFVSSVADGSGIDGARIGIGDASAITDGAGYYALSASRVKSTDSVLITKEGYADLRRSVSNFSGSDIDADFTLKPVDVAVEIDPSREEGNVITDLDGASVVIPALANIGGPLVVSLSSYDLGTEEINCVPGDFTALDTLGNDATIVSCGMIDVSIRKKDTGERISLAGYGDYGIRIPITGDALNAPDTIPMWYFDENRCTWIEQGTLTKSADDPGFYEGTVTHFSAWNADYKSGASIRIKGTIVDPSESDSYEVSLSFDGFKATYAMRDREFTIYNLPEKRQMQVSVKKMSTGQVIRKSFYSYNESGCVYVGEFVPDYYADVYGLTAKTDARNIVLAWTGEDPALDFVEIECIGDGGAELCPIAVPKGTFAAIIADLEEGYYTITVKGMFADSRRSSGIVREMRIKETYRLTIYNDTEENVLYSYNGTTGFTRCKTLEAVVPRKTMIMIDTDAEDKGEYRLYGTFGSSDTFPVVIEAEGDYDITATLTAYHGGPQS